MQSHCLLAPGTNQSIKAIDEIVRRGHEAHAAARFGEAYEHWFTALMQSPGRADLLLNLAVLCRRIGWLDHAKLFCIRAIKAASNDLLGLAHFTYGNILRSAQEFSGARLQYEAALTACPGLEIAQKALVKSCVATGDFSAAERHMKGVTSFEEDEIALIHAKIAHANNDRKTALDEVRRALLADVGSAHAWKQLYDLSHEDCPWMLMLHALESVVAELKNEKSRNEAAHAVLGTLINAKDWHSIVPFMTHLLGCVPPSFELYNLAGVALYNAEMFDALSDLYHQAKTIGYASAKLTQTAAAGAASAGHVDTARQLFADAVRKAPKDAEILSNASQFLFAIEEFEASILIARRAVHHAPELARTHLILAQPLKHIFRLAEAIAACEMGMAARYATLAERSALCLILGQALLDNGRHAEAMATLRKSVDYTPDLTIPWSALAFASLYCDNVPPSSVKALHLRAGRQYMERVGAKRRTAWPNRMSPEKRLRIGLVSADFRTHPIGQLLASWLPYVNHAQYEIFCYSLSSIEDPITSLIRSSADVWRKFGTCRYDQVINAVHEDEIDILIDLAGHTRNNALEVFAHKPAPVQLSWAGYVYSTGLDTFDGILHDPVSAPPDLDRQYVEPILRLRQMSYCYVPQGEPPPVVPTPALRNGYITFGCFNSVVKLNDRTLSIWAQVLSAVPAARLFLKAGQFGDPDVATFIRRRLAAHGVAPWRVDIEGPSPLPEFITAFDRIDVMLDPVPFNGGMTTLLGLWQGVPLLALCGDSHAGRVGASMMHSLSLPSWVADNVADLVAAAQAHANDLASLELVRHSMRDRLRKTSLGNGQMFADDMQYLWRATWRQCCARMNVRDAVS